MIDLRILHPHKYFGKSLTQKTIVQHKHVHGDVQYEIHLWYCDNLVRDLRYDKACSLLWNFEPWMSFKSINYSYKKDTAKVDLLNLWFRRTYGVKFFGLQLGMGFWKKNLFSRNYDVIITSWFYRFPYNLEFHMMWNGGFWYNMNIYHTNMELIKNKIPTHYWDITSLLHNKFLWNSLIWYNSVNIQDKGMKIESQVHFN